LSAIFDSNHPIFCFTYQQNTPRLAAILDESFVYDCKVAITVANLIASNQTINEAPLAILKYFNLPIF
jgi:hypothetical protein